MILASPSIGPYERGIELQPGSLGRRFRSVADTRPVIVETVSIRSDGEIFERAVHRIEVMAQLRHKNLLPILDAGIDGNELFLVMPAPERVVDGAKPLGTDARPVIAEVAKGLRFLHDNGVVHRDVQSCHIGWYEGVVQLGGVGLSGLLSGARTHGVGPIGGTLTMAPSLVHGEQASVGSDVYSLGATLHLLATGKAVHVQTAESLTSRIVRIGTEPPSIDSTLPPTLAPIVRAALACDGSEDLQRSRHILNQFATFDHTFGAPS